MGLVWRVLLGAVLALVCFAVTASSAGAAAPDGPGVEEHASQPPQPPRLPADFHGTGRWIVRSLGVDVPFRWSGRDGDSVMVAGGPNQPIWFKNIIFDNTLYTYTLRWPGLTQFPCDRVGFFNRGVLNNAMQGARFVGREILQLHPRRYVNHFRVGWVWPQAPPGLQIRLPLALGDIYVSRANPTRFWQVLQFGLQNLFDPELDEWLRMNRWSPEPGRVRLPAKCETAT
jgi:hypothetical protein